PCRSMKVPPRRPLTKYTIRPDCSTAYSRFGSAGVEAIAVSGRSPCANGCTESCCWWEARAAAARNAASIPAQATDAGTVRFESYLLLKQDLPELVFLAGLQDCEHLVSG